jgi:ectoine hydroxylase-related dioxygenase (phytanoyl-CoA dioxygenase family)
VERAIEEASPGEEQLEAFRRDGFIIDEGFIGPAAVEALRARFEPLFAGSYPTGVRPDEVNWVAGRDAEDRTRQLCNAWKADPVIAAQVLSERAGSLAAQLMGWSGARIVQDNVLWKPPGAKSLGMHQDASYAGYLVPPEMVTVWMALDDTVAEGGTVEYVRGSHRWPRVAPARDDFHAPEDWLAPVVAAAPAGEPVERVPVVVRAGGASIHHGLTFHGSGPNAADSHRRALVAHFAPAHARFDPVEVDLVYSRYRRRDDLALDESFFPVVWNASGGRSAWLEELPPLP